MKLSSWSVDEQLALLYLQLNYLLPWLLWRLSDTARTLIIILEKPIVLEIPASNMPFMAYSTFECPGDIVKGMFFRNNPSNLQ